MQLNGFGASKKRVFRAAGSICAFFSFPKKTHALKTGNFFLPITSNTQTHTLTHIHLLSSFLYYTLHTQTINLNRCCSRRGD